MVLMGAIRRRGPRDGGAGGRLAEEPEHEHEHEHEHDQPPTTTPLRFRMHHCPQLEPIAVTPSIAASRFVTSCESDIPSQVCAFAFLLLLSAYIGLTPHSAANPAIPSQNGDKLLHTFDFFLLTLIFYWVLDLTRRRVLQFTIVVCPGILGIGSEIVQGLLPNGRVFDLWDIGANLIGCAAALGTCVWYHRRMLERRRVNRFGSTSPHGDEEDDDLELGQRAPLAQNQDPDDGTGALGPQETGVVSSTPTPPRPQSNPKQTMEQELDNWDENAEDEDDDEWDVEGDGRSESNVGEPGPTHTSEMNSEVDEREHGHGHPGHPGHPLPGKKLRAD
ncbi:hypothetical protein KEM56_002906 [Ascosphaera pollenicola]|nr:hypothetical protein KEM56_002906 [Ascosphaera pollenicola]